MKKQAFYRYVAILLFGLVLSLALAVFFFNGYFRAYFQARSEEMLRRSTGCINQDITSLLEITQQDFQYLMEEKSALIKESFFSQTRDSAMEIVLTDSAGKVLFSTHTAPKSAVSGAGMREGTQLAREGTVVKTDLDRFYSEERLVRVLLLEKEHSETHRQRVGAVFLSLPVEAGTEVKNAVLSGMLVCLFILFSAFLLVVYLSYRDYFKPLYSLNRAAQKTSRGDFSLRLDEKKGGQVAPLVRSFNEMASTAEKNEKIRQSFVSNVAHDLRTPLTSIGGFIQNMADGIIPPEKYGHYFKIVLDEVARLSRLVQTLLETSRMTAGEKKYNFRPMDLCEVGRITLLSFERRLEEKRIQVAFESAEDSMTVLADEDSVSRVIYNLLDNAVKFTPEEGSLSVKITQMDKKALFAVENSGEGIPQEELSHLFERFYKSDRSRGLDKKGMGLGLFIAKSVIDAHGEEIWVESRVGEFTRFVFSLPLKNTDKNK
jgi:signal transduction histidine kinase